MDSFAISVSHGLQYGVPLKSYVRTLRGTSFAPSGITDDKEIRTASSITDYIMRRLALDYLSFDDQLELGIVSIDDVDLDVNESQTTLLGTDTSMVKTIDENTSESQDGESRKPKSAASMVEQSKPTIVKKAAFKDDTAPLCYNCGNQTQRAGTCYVCTSCGSTTGCS